MAFIHSYVIITTMPNQVVYLKNITKIMVLYQNKINLSKMQLVTS